MPTDIDFNRIENNQKNIYSELDIVAPAVGNIKTADQTWAGLKTFNIISTPALNDISGDITLGGVAASSLIKGRTYIIEGRSVVFSASIFNSVRANPGGNILLALSMPDFMGVVIFRETKEGYTFSNYSGVNAGISAGSNMTATLKNITTDTFFLNDTPLSAGEYSFNVGIGTIYYKISSGGLASVGFRRCKYPIVEDDPITAYDANYNPAPSKKITLADIDAFRVG